MTIESNIYDDVLQSDNVKLGFCDFKLLTSTSYAVLYMAVKSGKRFLIKTTKDKSEWQECLLRREYELALGVEHHNIVHVYSLENIAPYGLSIVMEYIDGRMLGDYLAEKPTRRECERIFTELLLAVEYLHKRGVVHNDIKPDNILISRTSNTLKLIDFGLADSDAEYAMRALGCTPRYASVELRARKDVDARSDIYSLGMIMEDIFGSSRISRRATKEHPSLRYANIAELRKAWHRRYMWWVVVIVLMLLLGGICYLYTCRNEHISSTSGGDNVPVADTIFVVVGNSEVVSGLSEPMPTPTLCDADVSLRELEESMAKMYQQTADSISITKYSEFAIPHFVRFWEQSDSLANALMTKAHDERESAYLSSRYEYLKYHYFEQLSALIDALPSILMLENDECGFYLSLIEHNQPFREYSPEE